MSTGKKSLFVYSFLLLYRMFCTWYLRFRYGKGVSVLAGASRQGIDCTSEHNGGRATPTRANLTGDV